MCDQDSCFCTGNGFPSCRLGYKPSLTSRQATCRSPRYGCTSSERCQHLLHQPSENFCRDFVDAWSFVSLSELIAATTSDLSSGSRVTSAIEVAGVGPFDSSVCSQNGLVSWQYLCHLFLFHQVGLSVACPVRLRSD